MKSILPIAAISILVSACASHSPQDIENLRTAGEMTKSACEQRSIDKVRPEVVTDIRATMAITNGGRDISKESIAKAYDYFEVVKGKYSDLNPNEMAHLMSLNSHLSKLTGKHIESREELEELLSTAPRISCKTECFTVDKLQDRFHLDKLNNRKPTKLENPRFSELYLSERQKSCKAIKL